MDSLEVPYQELILLVNMKYQNIFVASVLFSTALEGVYKINIKQ